MYSEYDGFESADWDDNGSWNWSSDDDSDDFEFEEKSKDRKLYEDLANGLYD